MKVLTLLSGGIDSSTVLYLARKQFDTAIAVSFNYGQKHQVELIQAGKIAQRAQVEHIVVSLNIPLKSALTQTDIPVPKNGPQNEIPSTYVPGRNTIFLSIAASIAESRDLHYIAIGANAVDYSGYPDCRPEYIQQFSKLLTLSNKRGVEGNPIKIFAPILNLKKSEILQLGYRLDVPYYLTLSCYDPISEKGTLFHCGKCDSCRIRQKGFKDLGLSDPTLYKEVPK